MIVTHEHETLLCNITEHLTGTKLKLRLVIALQQNDNISV